MFVELPPRRLWSDPWATESFASRITALRRGKTRVAYYYDLPDSSTFRYRVYNMIQVLRCRDDGISASWFCRADSSHFDWIADCCDVLVICRARYTDRLSSMIERAKNSGRTVIFDVDDLVVDTRYAHLLMDALDQDTGSEAQLDHWFGYIGRLSTVLQLCDRAITTNEYLASHIRASTGKDVRIVPNFINREQLEYSLQLHAAKRTSRFAGDGRIHLGYFSGSPSHDNDFELISDALARLLDKDPRLHVRLIGYLNVKGAVVRHRERIERAGMHDFLNLQHLIASTEINLVPLQDNTFTNCKSELKFFEAGIVGTITIASPVFAYRQAVSDGANGFLAGPCEWESKMLCAVETLSCLQGAYAEMAECAFEISRSRYSWDSQFRVIASALLGAPNGPPEKRALSTAIRFPEGPLSGPILCAPVRHLVDGAPCPQDAAARMSRANSISPGRPLDG
jgi:glycosyltransferase involved in cell wall biosynthesis